jgi:hypothetical protein
MFPCAGFGDPWEGFNKQAHFCSVKMFFVMRVLFGEPARLAQLSVAELAGSFPARRSLEGGLTSKPLFCLEGSYKLDYQTPL